MIIPTAIAGAWAHARLGHVEIRLVPPIATVSIVAAIGGAALANHLPAAALRVAFGALLVWVGARMAFASAPKQDGPRPKTEPVA
jgi:uncharacterized membrane protein YfcA